METKWFERLLQAAVIALAVAAVCQEMEKPKEERKWYGRVARFIPYDFRAPTLERVRNAYWNPYDHRLFTHPLFGIGWAVNFYALLDDLGLIGASPSEEDFLMPTRAIKDLIRESSAAD
jgi:hypothetical protein